MSPSYSVKNGVRYRFYVSSALLRGRKSAAGAVTRVPALEIEQTVAMALAERAECSKRARASPEDALGLIERINVHPDRLSVAFCKSGGDHVNRERLELSWSKPPIATLESVETSRAVLASRRDVQSIQQIVRAHAWLKLLTEGRFDSIEALAGSIELHPKVVRQQIQFAFVSSNTTAEILNEE